ncbi:hypothetical protein RI367_000751 [Sorochytrium milnesiophthora]
MSSMTSSPLAPYSASSTASSAVSPPAGMPVTNVSLFQGIQRGRSVSQPVPFHRSAHSMTEKRRRDRMNEALDTLRAMVPACQSRETNKIDVLLETIDYINQLHLQYGVPNVPPIPVSSANRPNHGESQHPLPPHHHHHHHLQQQQHPHHLGQQQQQQQSSLADSAMSRSGTSCITTPPIPAQQQHQLAQSHTSRAWHDANTGTSPNMPGGSYSPDMAKSSAAYVTTRRHDYYHRDMPTMLPARASSPLSLPPTFDKSAAYQPATPSSQAPQTGSPIPTHATCANSPPLNSDSHGPERPTVPSPLTGDAAVQLPSISSLIDLAGMRTAHTHIASSSMPHLPLPSSLSPSSSQLQLSPPYHPQQQQQQQQKPRTPPHPYRHHSHHQLPVTVGCASAERLDVRSSLLQ